MIPQRYVIAILAFWATLNAYQSRMCLHVSITEMVVTKNEKDANSSYYHDPDACPDDRDTEILLESSKNVTNGDLFDWDEETQGLILSAFFWGYVVLQIPGGLLADKFGGKYVLGFGILGSSVFTLLIPVAAKAGYGWLLATLVTKGLTEGTTFPAIDALLSRWVPLEERGLLATFVLSGLEIGTITGVLISGYLLETFRGNWPLVFYVFGGIGILWVIVWTLIGHSDPEAHPFISDREKRFLRETVGDRRKTIPPTPWLPILKSIPLWAAIVSEFGTNWAYFTMLTDLPKYMKDVLKYSIEDNKIVSAVPYIATWLVSLSSGWIGDVAIRRKWLSVTATRKLFSCINHIGFPLALIAASYGGCDRTLVVGLFILALALSGTYYPAMGINFLDLSPNYAATIAAVANTLGCIAGIVTPYLVGLLTPNHTLREWRTFFWINIAVNVFCLVIVLWGASGEVQPWDNLNAKKNLKKENVSNVNLVFTIENDVGNI